MRANGASPEDVFLAAAGQHDTFAGIRAVRAVFGLNLEAAKEVMIRALGDAKSLAEYQTDLLPSLKEVLGDDDQSLHDST